MGGMLFSTVLNLIFIPVLYVILKSWLTAAGTAKMKETEPVAKDLAA